MGAPSRTRIAPAPLMPQPPLRRSGVLTEWDDERGYGFIVPLGGGRKVFAHVSEYPRSAPRPADGDELSFELGPGANGRTQAVAIEVLRSARQDRIAAGDAVERGAAVERRRGRIELLVLLPAAVFVVLYVLAITVWDAPLWLAVLYPAMSAATFALYLLDKRAAVDRGWRVREATLQAAALLGGWPGAVVAQQVLRHKNRKAAFQSVFWILVTLNLGAFVFVLWWPELFSALGWR